MAFVPQLALKNLDLKLPMFQDDTIIDLVIAHDCNHFLSKHCKEAMEIQLFGDMEVRQSSGRVHIMYFLFLQEQIKGIIITVYRAPSPTSALILALRIHA